MDEARSNILKNSNLTENIIEILPFFVYITDEDGNIIYMNKKIREFIKQTGNDAAVQNIYELVKKYKLFMEDGEKIRLKDFPVYKALNDKKEIRDTIIKFKKDYIEEFKYVSLSTFPLIENQRVLGAVLIIRDITEDYVYKMKIRNEREKFLELSTELKTKCDIIEILRNREKEHLMHLKDVINNISEGIMVFDTHGKLSLCNKAVFNILNVKAIELVNEDILDKFDIITLDSENEESKEPYYSYMHNKRPMKNLVLKVRRKGTIDTKYIELNSQPIINKNDKLVYTILTIKDVTETKLHQINAEEQAAFVRDVVNTVDVPIAVVDYPSITYRLTNKKYEEIMEYRSYEKKIKSQNCMDQNLYKILECVGEKCKAYTITPYKIKDKKGEERFYKIRFIPYKSKDITTRIHVHGSDVTEEINHNIELEKLTKLKDEFFTIISHELRTPLTIIYSSLQLANDVYKKEITPNIDKTLSRINQNCSRLLKLINNILDISKAEAGFLSLSISDFDIVYVTESIVNSCNSYAVSKGIELIFDTNEEECNVRLDKDKYEKILLNFLSNAVKFTPEGKQIIVSLKIKKDYFYLSVKDYGVGISEDKINCIFDRFAQVNSSLSRRAEGTGIGLALVKKIVELMEGKISVNSKVAYGTEFIVKFKKICSDTNDINSHAILTENINDRIDIEFSDIN